MFEVFYSKDDVKAKKERSKKIVAVSNQINYFKYDVSQEKLYQVFSKFIKKNQNYWNEYSKYIILITAFKSVDGWNVFEKCFKEFNGKDGYKSRDWNHQPKHWNGIKKFNEYNCFNHILLDIEERTLLDYIKYKPIYEPKIEFSKTINRQKLGKNKNIENDKDYVKIQKNVDYALKSGTGTGKTTLVKKYLEKTGQKFISIVSRMTLAYEQYKTFQEEGIDVNYYKHYENHFIPKHSNVVIQIDSIMKLSSWCEYDDWNEEPSIIGDYVIFLDEYASLIEHLITSPHMKKSRALCFKVFCKILKNAKQIICADADLNAYSLKMLELCGRDPILIDNLYQHNKGVPAQEYFELTSFIEEMKSKDKFLLCTDTASGGKAIFEEHFCKTQINHTAENMIEVNGKEINKYSISIGQDEKGYVVFISAENDFMPNLDEWNRVIFSPKIVYGLDSTIRRDVFSMNKEFSISPRGIHQQVARCRDIVKLHYIFFNKKFHEPNFIDIPDVKDKLKRLVDLTDWKEICDADQVETFMKLMSVMEYNNDCYSTNKFCHFKLLLKQRGFIDAQTGNKYQTAKKQLNEIVKKCQDNELKEFSKNTDKVKYQKINETLKIPEDQMEEHKELFVKDGKRDQYYSLRSYLMQSGNDIENRLESQQEFNVNKMRSKEYKIIFFTELMKKVGCKNKIDIDSTKVMSKEDSTMYFNKMDELFRFRFDEWKEDIFTTKIGIDNVIHKTFTKLFGSGFSKKYIPTEEQVASGNTQRTHIRVKMFKDERKQINKVRYTTHKLNEECIRHYFDLIKFYYQDIKSFDDYDWSFDKNRKDNQYDPECLIPKTIWTNIDALDHGIKK